MGEDDERVDRLDFDLHGRQTVKLQYTRPVCREHVPLFRLVYQIVALCTTFKLFEELTQDALEVFRQHGPDRFCKL